MKPIGNIKIGIGRLGSYKEKDLVDPNVSFEEYMDKHEKPEGNKPVITEDEKREFEHDMFS